MLVLPLDDRHDRKGFDCGEAMQLILLVGELPCQGGLARLVVGQRAGSDAVEMVLTADSGLNDGIEADPLARRSDSAIKSWLAC